ncbi:DotD/TraH family lipoprotein [Candidatus Synchoanobacter obligatus]|uniref:DotD/TraH family lipoprotein n=1 Tax=Candidatus Synchoanobacter obligatus TaxID=2919597 RepID=A0ABT1L7U3_9GAMM|nr:DotD/TraH family lipoprotein [Candidatus Synchoanobacter obligatus]MCP8352363.1 DotD/TraH family lipoprotein [Candidatus Synchoanobacter obligatus]
MKKSIICLGVSTLLFGCGGGSVDEYAMTDDGHKISISPNVTKSSNDTEIAIAEAARAATTSLQKLAQLRYASQPASDDSFRQEFSVELSGLASVEYTGPCEPLIEQIGKTANVKISKIGNPTATPIIISVQAKSAPLSEIIQNIAYQIQGHARISFNTESKAIEIMYLNT